MLGYLAKIISIILSFAHPGPEDEGMRVHLVLKEVGEDATDQEHHVFCDQSREGGGNEQVLLVSNNCRKPHGSQCRLEHEERL